MHAPHPNVMVEAFADCGRYVANTAAIVCVCVRYFKRQRCGSNAERERKRKRRESGDGLESA